MVDNRFVEAVTASLIREYLSRKGLKATLQLMDIEMPRTDDSVSNRVALMKKLHIEKPMKYNKMEPKPLRSMIEVVTKYILEHSEIFNANNGKSPIGSSPKSTQTTMTSERKGRLRSKSSETPDMRAQTKTSIIGANGDCAPTNKKDILSQMRNANNPKKENRHDSSPRNREELTFENFSSVTNLRDEEGAVPVPSNALYSNTFLDEFFHDEHCQDSKFVSYYYHLKCKNKTHALADPSTVKLSYIPLLQDLDPEKNKKPSNIVSITNIDHDNNSNSVREASLEQSSSLETLEELRVDDVDDSEILDFVIPPSRIFHLPPTANLRSPIDLSTAMKLKILVLGSPNSQFSPEWAKQNLEFCTLPGLQYGMVQKKGGPCGLLAAIQSYVLMELLFGEDPVNTYKSFEPTPEQCRKSLAAALSRIFWQAGDNISAVVTLSSNTTHFIGGTKCKPDRLTETLMIYQFNSYRELNSFIQKNIILFESEGSSGLVLTLYSVILSRSVLKIRSEMDEPNSKLMASYGYCSQELVNLFVTGNAVSNVFDNEMELDSGTKNAMVLRGIQHPSSIGFLSLFEHYNNTKVGSFYKNPKYPIWIVCSESHFTVLFSLCGSLVKAGKFDLYYYDGLAQQQNPIRLTIDKSNPYFRVSSEEDLVPPLELCIRTKWRNAQIDWNSTEPLL